MRGVLFRGKDVETGEWIEGDLLQDPFDIDIAYDCQIRDRDDGRLFTVDPRTVGQYSQRLGIFEGDIFVFDISRMGTVAVRELDLRERADKKGLVEWNEHIEGFQVTLRDDNGSKAYYDLLNAVPKGFVIKDIGNIHDTPELWFGEEEDDED